MSVAAHIPAYMIDNKNSKGSLTLFFQPKNFSENPLNFRKKNPNLFSSPNDNGGNGVTEMKNGILAAAALVASAVGLGGETAPWEYGESRHKRPRTPATIRRRAAKSRRRNRILSRGR